jgi:DNA-binding beta-propeller fold protein YncE
MKLISRIVLGALASFALSGPLAAQDVPQFQVDPLWPKTLPSNWIMGSIAGIYVDGQGHVWVNHRPGSLSEREVRASVDGRVECCFPAPPVIEFDQEGNVVQAWGGPGEGYDWPGNEHGIYVDYNDYVWVGGNGAEDGVILKFTRTGQFVLQIGMQGPGFDSADTSRVAGASNMIVDSQTNELYVADGYRNHRVIVFDAATGEYKRMWGAYGNEPEDRELPEFDPYGTPPNQFANPVHCINMTRDGEIFVCDRAHNRLQVFDKEGGFQRQIFVSPETAPGTTGSVVFWPDDEQSLLFSSDDTNGKIHILTREDGLEVGSFGRVGNMVGEFNNLHLIAIDRQGNIYTAETQGKRIQKFVNMSGL